MGMMLRDEVVTSSVGYSMCWGGVEIVRIRIVYEEKSLLRRSGNSANVVCWRWERGLRKTKQRV